ncbi:MAG: proline iminopeptidase-family hydrolase [Proteobacteria bacterium]|nr:proline iminopeptidase-family hydrolase [Pseudomonadota bacterium]MBS0421655.1 proline iminopeptidase-family hydrolase [Pseudomonadota bacterium]
MQPLVAHTQTIALKSGHSIVTYRYGPPVRHDAEVVLLLNGGPGLPNEYLGAPHARLVNRGFTVIGYDQLGCGRSDQPKKDSLWTLERYVDELAQVCAALRLPPVHLLGHSWGTWLGTEFCLTRPGLAKTYVIADGACDIPHLVSELDRLRAALGSETVNMMLRREAAGSIHHPEYEAAVTLLNYRHVCRNEVWPETLTRSLAAWNRDPYVTMQGPNEFTYTGNMRNWNRVPDMHAIRIPCLVIAGEHDELTPACARRMHDALPDSRLVVFENCSHMPFYEDPSAYFGVLEAFLLSHSGEHWIR